MTVSVGSVKWFGGHNSKTERENAYGFLEDIAGQDVFIHLKEWQGGSAPKDNQILTYTLENSKGKWAAKNATDLTSADYSLDTLLALLDLSIGSEKSTFSKRAGDELKSSFCGKFSTVSSEEKAQCFEQLGQVRLIGLLAGREKWSDNLSSLYALDLINPITDTPWERLPEHFFIEHGNAIADYLLTLDINEARLRVIPALSQLPPALIMLSVLSGIITNADELSIGMRELDAYIQALFMGDESRPPYLNDYIDTVVKPKGGVLKDPLIGHLFEYYLFKKYLYEKNIKFVALYESSDYLKSRLDIFILVKIFSLLLSGNSVEKVYSLFMGDLWQAITAKSINPIDQADQLHELFPACSTMPGNLSCEAVYWQKQDKFLCRGRQCHNPKVIHDLSRSYFEYTAYDWFTHYGIAYSSEKAPSAKDFPIKLAAYLNRLREIYDVIHCRSCSMLMLPDMRYSRVEYTTYEKGKFVKKDMAASYRLTVFKCPNSACPECGNGHYINHCLGFDCYDIIDTRDCKTQCDAGRYICKGCGSCCGEHAKSNPVGLCPDCGAPLKLFETQEYERFNKKKKRFVKCSHQECGFTISSDKLSKRFYLDSCGPVIQLNR